MLLVLSLPTANLCQISPTLADRVLTCRLENLIAKEKTYIYSIRDAHTPQAKEIFLTP